MMKAFAIALVLAFGSTVAFAEDDDDKVHLRPRWPR